MVIFVCAYGSMGIYVVDFIDIWEFGTRELWRMPPHLEFSESAWIKAV